MKEQSTKGRKKDNSTNKGKWRKEKKNTRKT